MSLYAAQQSATERNKEIDRATGRAGRARTGNATQRAGAIPIAEGQRNSSRDLANRSLSNFSRGKTDNRG
jgi:hypothetical protein